MDRTFGQRFGDLIARKREERGWSFAQLAVAAYGDDGHGGEKRKADVQKLEAGNSRKPNAATIRKYRLALDLKQEEIEACYLTKSSQDVNAHVQSEGKGNGKTFAERGHPNVAAVQRSRDAEYAYLFAQLNAGPHHPGEIAQLLQAMQAHSFSISELLGFMEISSTGRDK